MSGSRKAFLWILIISCAAGSTILTKNLDNSSQVVGYFVGAVIGMFGFAGILVFLFAGLFWLFKRRRMSGIGASVLVTAAVIGGLGTLGSLAQISSESANSAAAPSVREWQEFAEETAQLTHSIDDRRFDEEGYLVEDTKPVSVQSKFSGDLGKLDQLIRTQQERTRQVDNSYSRAIDRLSLESLYDPNYLERVDDFSEAKLLLAQATAEVRLYSRKTLALFDQAENDVLELELESDEMYRELLKGFYETLEPNKENTAQNLKLEAAVIENMKERIFLLSNFRGHWWFEDEQLYSDSDEFLGLLNENAEQLDYLIAEQSALTNKMRLDQLKKVEAMRAAFR